MKIEFEVPEWAKNRRISIFAGNELLAQKNVLSTFNPETKKHEFHQQKLRIKVGRCSGCGDCCNTGGSPFPEKMLEEIKKRLKNYNYQQGIPCPLVDKDGCILKGKILFSCASSNCEGWSKNCTEMFD
ncbi:MAG: hypothetical protein ACTSPK_00180 [Candidatus Heimdallarchaeota archaeon]